MSRHLHLEGDDLAQVLRQARHHMGPGARIVSAERVRYGGVFGWFTKERFELVVEVGGPPRVDPTSLPTPARVEPVTVGIDALVAAAEAAESTLANPRSPRLSTSGPDFENLLADLQASLGISRRRR